MLRQSRGHAGGFGEIQGVSGVARGGDKRKNLCTMGMPS